jgi:hypothetical protein
MSTQPVASRVATRPAPSNRVSYSNHKLIWQREKKMSFLELPSNMLNNSKNSSIRPYKD